MAAVRALDVDQGFVRTRASLVFRNPAWFGDLVSTQGPKVSRRFAVKRAVWKVLVDLWVHKSLTVEEVLTPQVLTAYRSVAHRGHAGEAFLQATFQRIFDYEDDTIEWYSKVEESSLAEWSRPFPIVSDSDFLEHADDADDATFFSGTNMTVAKQVMRYGIRPRSSVAPRTLGEGFSLTRRAPEAADDARKASLPTFVPVVMKFRIPPTLLDELKKYQSPEDPTMTPEAVVDGVTRMIVLTHAARRPLLDAVRACLARCVVVNS